MAKILMVDDEITMIQMTVELLRSVGHEVFPCSNVAAALAVMENNTLDLVITDLYLEKARAIGLEIVEKSKLLHPPPVVIVITAFATVETAVEAMKRGAFDYLKKPFNLQEFQLCIQRALTYNRAVSENAHLRKQLKQKYRFDQIVGKSSKMFDVFKMVDRVANTDSTILILGESGTGKELVARALHYNSRRQQSPFVPINCSALPENLLESELFGHRKGSFTGALTDKKGLFQEAEGGTIFLDEIGSMSPLLQSRLLRVLQDREVRRVGDNASVYVNVRVLAATNEPLEKKMQQGTFREDLFYRLNVIALKLPSLRERRDDIPLLVAHFLKGKIQHESGKTFQITHEAMEALCAYSWPGNVRELENAIERACALCDREIIALNDLPPALLHSGLQTPPETEVEEVSAPRFAVANAPIYPLQQNSVTSNSSKNSSVPGCTGTLKAFIRQQELNYLNRALAEANGDKEHAADRLGISLATLYRKLSPEEDV